MGIQGLADQLQRIQQQNQLLQRQLSSLPPKERRAVYQRLAGLAQDEANLGDQVRHFVQEYLHTLTQRRDRILAQITLLERLAAGAQIDEDLVAALAAVEAVTNTEQPEYSSTPVSTRTAEQTAPTGEHRFPKRTDPRTEDIGSGAYPDASVVEAPVNGPSSDTIAPGPQLVGKQPAEEAVPVVPGVTKNPPASSPPTPLSNLSTDSNKGLGRVPPFGSSGRNISLPVDPSVLGVGNRSLDYIRVIDPTRGLFPYAAPAIPVTLKERPIVKKASQSRRTRPAKQPDPPPTLPTPLLPIGETPSVTESTQSPAPVTESSTPEGRQNAPIGVDKSLGEAPVGESPATWQQGTADPAAGQDAETPAVDPSSEPKVIVAEVPSDPARINVYTQKCQDLMLVASKSSLAMGWLLASFIEQIDTAYPVSLPRPLEIEIACQVLPRLSQNKHIVVTDLLTQSMVVATQGANGEYQLSPGQAHIRMALGLPLLLFNGVEHAYAWILAAKDQSDSPALRHWADQACGYWQRTHVTLKDTGVLDDVEEKQKRAQLAQLIQEHFDNTMYMSITYSPAAKVKARLFPRQGDGGLRWVLAAVQQGELIRLQEWRSTFEPEAEIDKYTRLVSSFKDKVDYSARSKLVEAMLTLKERVAEWCNTFQAKGPKHSRGLVSQARQFVTLWEDKKYEYQTAISSLPEQQSVARGWLMHTFNMFSQQLGGNFHA